VICINGRVHIQPIKVGVLQQKVADKPDSIFMASEAGLEIGASQRLKPISSAKQAKR
jgi:hypothetical protein